MLDILTKKDYTSDLLGINNLRGLAIDMIDNASSGHPGICLGAAGIVYTLFKRHLIINLEDSNYINRDRFIMSAGHGSPLLYGIFYMLDVLSLDDLKKLRKINSKTPGHPEYKKTPFVEISTGPLGTGVASSVGFAIAEEYLKKISKGNINYYTYVLCGDGELEEGITYESLSLAGNLKLKNLIVLLDSNNVTLDSYLTTSSCENIKERFSSIGFSIFEAGDDPESIDNALKNAKNSDKPSIIICKTTIGLYSKNQGTNLVHGKPLDYEDILNVKNSLHLLNTPFAVSKEAVLDLKGTINNRFKEHKKNNKLNLNNEIVKKIINKEITYNLTDLEVNYENKSLRDLSGIILNEIANNFDLLIGGSADLSSSCKTNLTDYKVFNQDDYSGRNIYFGIREGAMSCILNGLALSNIRPFGSTFLSFSNYMNPGIRMSAMMNLPVLYIFTHDSITVGEDGPTHHPIEQLASLELIPNLKIYRPYDLNELIGCFREIMANLNPSVLVLPRDNKEISTLTKSSEIKNGIYLVKNAEYDNYINLVSNGEELGLVLKVADNLETIGIHTKVYSIPVIKNANKFIIEKLKSETTIGITFGVPNYYYFLTDKVIGINEFSLSGSKDELLDYFGFTEKKLESKILEILNK